MRHIALGATHNNYSIDRDSQCRLSNAVEWQIRPYVIGEMWGASGPMVFRIPRGRHDCKRDKTPRVKVACPSNRVLLYRAVRSNIKTEQCNTVCL